MSYTISDTILNLFNTPEVSLTIEAFLATDFAQIPSKFMTPPANVIAQATTVADSAGNFTITVPLDDPVYLAAASSQNTGVYYWAIGRNVDLGVAAGSVPAAGVATSKVSAFGVLGQYNTNLTALTTTDYAPLQLDLYGREAKGGKSVNILTVASAANTGVTSSGTITYNNSASYYDVSMFDDITIKLNITLAAGGTSPTVQLLADLVDANDIAYNVYASDAMATTAGTLTLTRYVSLGKAAATAATGTVQGENVSLAGAKLQLRLLGGGTTSNTSITYSLAVDGR